MGKVSKERYKFFIDEYDEFDWCVIDNDTNEIYEYLEDITNILNQQHKKIQELEHQLSNCIEPKFKVGQEVWHCFKNCNEPDKTVIESIDIEVNEKFIDFTYYDVDGFGFDEIMLFTTEEEAKKHLEELKDG